MGFNSAFKGLKTSIHCLPQLCKIQHLHVQSNILTFHVTPGDEFRLFSNIYSTVQLTSKRQLWITNWQIATAGCMVYYPSIILTGRRKTTENLGITCLKNENQKRDLRRTRSSADYITTTYGLGRIPINPLQTDWHSSRLEFFWTRE